MIRERFLTHLLKYSIVLSSVAGVVIHIYNEWRWLLFQGVDFSELLSLLLIGALIGMLFVFPVLLTLLNTGFLVIRSKDPGIWKQEKPIEYITIILGSFYSLLARSYYNILYMDWMKRLRNSELHTPIWSEAMPTIVVLFCIAVSGYIILSFINVNKVPPLVSVCAIAAMYLGVLLCVIWIVQIFSTRHIYMCLFPFNCIIIAAKIIRRQVGAWQRDQQEKRKKFKNPILRWMNECLMNSKRWPLIAFLMMWPLLGVIIIMLVLFGQWPDYLVMAWTETSDWNLSQRIAPPNTSYDEHYLCTAAAHGHEKVVKPIRMGERHGHRIVVNRQLCIANAFEQILEERIPLFHKPVRRFYDNYGFPLSRLIRSRYAADVVYILMKPLEWFFLIVIYFCDVHPENRIARQYLPQK